MAKKPIKITEVVLRDSHQSLLATRMTMDEMRPILPAMDEIGYFSVECWGGATFDSCIRFWMKTPGTACASCAGKCRTPSCRCCSAARICWVPPLCRRRGGVLCAEIGGERHRHHPHFRCAERPRNLETAIKAANKEKAHVQGCISYTLSPVHNNEYFAEYAKTLEEMGAHSICIKDMAGLLTPYTCYDLVKKLKETVNIPIDIHSHYTAGLASMSILKGIEAGADIIDTAMSPLAPGYQPYAHREPGRRPAGHRLRHRP